MRLLLRNCKKLLRQGRAKERTLGFVNHEDNFAFDADAENAISNLIHITQGPSRNVNRNESSLSPSLVLERVDLVDEGARPGAGPRAPSPAAGPGPSAAAGRGVGAAVEAVGHPGWR